MIRVSRACETGGQFLKLSDVADGATSDNRFTILKSLHKPLQVARTGVRVAEACVLVLMRLVMKLCNNCCV